MYSKKEIKLLAVEDHDSVSLGIAHYLQEIAKMPCQILSASDYHQAHRLLMQKTFDVVLLDIYLTEPGDKVNNNDGDALLREITKMKTPPKVIVYSKMDRLDMLDYLIHLLGAEGYILKGRKSLEEIPKAIEKVLEGESYYSPPIQKLMRHYDKQLDLNYADRTILKGLSMGLTQPQVRDFLGKKGRPLSLSSIEKRIGQLKSKYNSSSLAELISVVTRKGII